MSMKRKEGWYWTTSIEGGVFQPVYVRCDGEYMVNGSLVNKSEGYDNLVWYKAKMPDESGKLKDGWYWVKYAGSDACIDKDWHPAQYSEESSKWFSHAFSYIETRELLIGERIERDD